MTVHYQVGFTEVEFSVTNIFWYGFRRSIINSFIRFLQQWIEVETDRENKHECYYYDYLSELKTLKNEYLSKRDKNVEINYTELFTKYEDALACFDFLGILVFIKKDDSGIFSCGNCLDMYIVLNKINKYIDVEYKSAVSDFKKVLKYSANKKIPTSMG
jgi:hypothetical protein